MCPKQWNTPGGTPPRQTTTNPCEKGGFNNKKGRLFQEKYYNQNSTYDNISHIPERKSGSPPMLDIILNN